MRRYLLDSGPAQSYVQRIQPVYGRARAEMRAGNRVGICMPVVGELFAGVESSHTRDRNRIRLLHSLHDLVMWPFDRDSAEEFGRVSAFVRSSGRPMQQIDMQIAAIALTLGNCTLVTKDTDFSAIPGLAIEDWS